jgi:hypothetical protein
LRFRGIWYSPTDDKCTEFQGDKVSHSDKGCHKGRAESKSLSLSGVVASQKLCLVRFDNDDCNGSGIRQDISVSLEGELHVTNRTTITAILVV